MKSILLGSSVLAAWGTAALAAADDGVRLTIGGSYQGAAGAVLAEDFSASAGVRGDDLRPYVFTQDVEIRFAGETTLDNGLTVGASVELEGLTEADNQIDKVYAHFSGGFGQLRFGDVEEAYAEFCYLVPSASELFGADSPNFNFSNAGIAGYGATNGTCYGLDDNATKIVYFSPVFAGFRFAASFTPDRTEDTRNTLDGAGTRFTDDDEQNSQNLSLAATFQREFGDLHVVLGGGITQSFEKEPNPGNVDPARNGNAYAQLGFAGFTVGIASEWRNNNGADSADQWVLGAGVAYGWDEWALGFGWTRGDYEAVVDGGDAFNADHDIYSLTASRQLADGVSVDGVIEYSDYRSRDGEGPDYQGLAIGLGTNIEF